MTPTEPGKRAILVGPVLPFRGGIAQHTTMLHRALTRECALQTLSFHRLYPRLLFPGESDRDPGFAGHQEPGVSYQIDSLNPFSWLRAARAIDAHAAELVVMPWWTIFWAPLSFFLGQRARHRGCELVFLCHNVIDHESASWKRFLTRQVLRLGSRFVVHSSSEQRRLQQLLPAAQVSVSPHPIYEQFPPARHTLNRRARLELLFFGFVRPYKGLDVLLRAVAQLPELDIHLTIAGEFWNGREATDALIRTLGIADRIGIIDHYVEEQEVAELFARADAVVLPYREATGSGVIPLAYHYATPVIATAVGGITDVVNRDTGLLVPPDDPAALAAAINAFSTLNTDSLQQGIQQARERFAWPALARAVLGQ